MQMVDDSEGKATVRIMNSAQVRQEPESQARVVLQELYHIVDHRRGDSDRQQVTAVIDFKDVVIEVFPELFGDYCIFHQFFRLDPGKKLVSFCFISLYRVVSLKGKPADVLFVFF